MYVRDCARAGRRACMHAYDRERITIRRERGSCSIYNVPLRRAPAAASPHARRRWRRARGD